MKISVLASSSSGNCSVISAGGCAVLVDAGISALRIRRGLEVCGLAPAALEGIFITHEHADHISGLGALCKKCQAPVYCSRYMRDDLRCKTDAQMRYIEPGCELSVGGLKVTPFAVSHDALDPMGFIFEHGGVKLGYVTDTGHIPRQVEAALHGVHILYVESNYDEDMLHNSGRPWRLIERIEGRWGHLSNMQACELVQRVAHPALQHVILAHLSSECNTPACAEKQMKATLQQLGLPTHLHIAHKDRSLPWISCNFVKENSVPARI